jgi:hypothetical protein
MPGGVPGATSKSSGAEAHLIFCGASFGWPDPSALLRAGGHRYKDECEMCRAYGLGAFAYRVPNAHALG